MACSAADRLGRQRTLSRLGRSLGQIVAILDALAKADVAFVALKENIRVEDKRDIETKVDGHSGHDAAPSTRLPRDCRRHRSRTAGLPGRTCHLAVETIATRVPLPSCSVSGRSGCGLAPVSVFTAWTCVSTIVK